MISVSDIIKNKTNIKTIKVDCDTCYETYPCQHYVYVYMYDDKVEDICLDRYDIKLLKEHFPYIELGPHFE
jgi:hypothetical protein